MDDRGYAVAVDGDGNVVAGGASSLSQQWPCRFPGLWLRKL